MRLIFLIFAGALSVPIAAAAPAPEIVWTGLDPGPLAKAALVFQGGKVRGELTGTYQGEDFTDDAGSRATAGALLSEKSASYLLDFHDGGAIRWAAKSYAYRAVTSTGATDAGYWNVALEIRGGRFYYERADDGAGVAAGPLASISRLEGENSTPDFYKGATGLELFSALASSELQEAAGKGPPAKLGPAERDEILTSAFLQVFDLPHVVKEAYDPRTKAVSVVIGADGNAGGGFQYALTLPDPVPAARAEAFLKTLPESQPVLRFSYAARALSLKSAEIRAGGKVYRADAAAAPPVPLPKPISALAE